MWGLIMIAAMVFAMTPGSVLAVEPLVLGEGVAISGRNQGYLPPLDGGLGESSPQRLDCADSSGAFALSI